jgi:hypothetical protein
MEGRGTVAEGGTESGLVCGVDKSEISKLGRLGLSEVGSEVLDESFENDTSSSSMSFSEDSDSVGVFALSRVRGFPRLSCLSRVIALRRTFLTGATGVVIASGLRAGTSSSESLSSAPSFDPRLGYKN